MKFTLSYLNRILLFLCVFVFCFVVGSFLVGWLLQLKGQTAVMLHICAVLQDIFVFIIPSLVTVIMITRLPADFLEVNVRPRMNIIILASLALIASIPAMNALIAWNESIHLPAGLAEVEQWMRQAEDNAQQSISLMLGGDNIGSLIVNILIIGFFAGFSEELFFRGTMQRLLTTGRMNVHVAVWLVAFIFSATHLQFYGFFGRLALGAFFGYLLYWTRCLWIPIIIHILNNSLYILGNYFSENNSYDFNSIGYDSVFLIIPSVIVTATLIVLLCQKSAGLNRKNLPTE